MKTRRPIIIALAATLLITALAGCGGKKTETASAVPEAPQGIYTNRMDYSQSSSRLSGTQAMNSEKETVGQLSALIVFSTENKAVADKDGSVVRNELGSATLSEEKDTGVQLYRYIFTKTAIIAGEDWPYYVRGQYTGYCTYDKETGTVTMYTPEKYMMYLMNAARSSSPDPTWTWAGIDTSVNPAVTEEVLAAGASGMNFSGEWQDYHGYTRPDPLDVTLNTDGTFSYVSQYLTNNSFENTIPDSYFEDGGSEYDMNALIDGNKND